MTKSFVVLVLMASCGWAGSASANCVNIDPVIVPQLRLDPLSVAGSAGALQPVQLVFRRATVDAAPVPIRYQIVDENSQVQLRVGISQGPSVAWQSQDSSREIGAFRSEGYTLLRTGELAIGQNNTAAQANLLMRLVNLREDLPAGVYREQFTVRYWCGDEDSQAYEAPGVIAVSVAVPNVLSASVAGASANGEVDFMDFEVRTRELMVSVRSTGPFKVTARSVNGGALFREGVAAPSDDADRIRYTATLDGLPLTVSETSTQLRERTGLLGRQLTLAVQVEDVGAKRAGAYADTLMLTLSPAN